MKKAVSLKAMKLISSPDDPIMEFETRGAIAEVEFNNKNSLKVLQEAVGGLIECVSLPSLGLAMFVNEEGKLTNLPIQNLDATALYQKEYNTKDVIIGDVIFTNLETDKEGNTLGLTDNQRTALLDNLFKMQEKRSGITYFLPVLR